MRTSLVSVLLVGGLLGCKETVVVIEAPRNLTYELEPSGDPLAPAGLLLRWEPVSSASLDAYRVYSRGLGEAFGLRGETTSPSFHDRGQPHLDYYVTAITVDGIEGPPSDVVTVDERLRLQSPSTLVTTSLDGAIHLAWSDNPFEAAPAAFKQYRVYSALYSLDSGDCGLWSLEGTTVAPEFLSAALPNGVPRCFGVSAQSIEGWESLWSPIRADTPRPEARNVLVWAHDVDASASGFRFFRDLDGDGAAARNELGLVGSGDAADMDFRVTRDGSGNFFLVPVRSATALRYYDTAPIPDLTSIDVAPVSGYARVALQAVPLWGYVFEMDEGDGFLRYGALRMTHVGREYAIFDWSYQTDPGNPELIPGGR